MPALQYIQGQICNEVALTALIRYDRNRNKPMLNCSTPCTSDNIPEHKTFWAGVLPQIRFLFPMGAVSLFGWPILLKKITVTYWMVVAPCWMNFKGIGLRMPPMSLRVAHECPKSFSDIWEIQRTFYSDTFPTLTYWFVKRRGAPNIKNKTHICTPILRRSRVYIQIHRCLHILIHISLLFQWAYIYIYVTKGTPGAPIRCKRWKTSMRISIVELGYGHWARWSWTNCSGASRDQSDWHAACALQDGWIRTIVTCCHLTNQAGRGSVPFPNLFRICHALLIHVVSQPAKCRGGLFGR